jgi:hypothetical protein
MNYNCFLIEPSGRQKILLRRYVSSDQGKCPGLFGYHNAETPVGEAAEKKRPDGLVDSIPVSFYADDPRWPARCGCGYEFKLADEFQVFTETIYRRADTGEEMILRTAPPGAMWNAWWMRDCAQWVGPDGQALMVKMPGGHEWHIDGPASNCDSLCKKCGKPSYAHNQPSPLPDQPNLANCPGYEDAHPHKCWVRTGVAPQLTVGKGAPGESCGAGAGSIVVPGWHGFLRNGVLEQC